jgi:CRP/FNR family nitrogen fixation transcriptional regulator
MFVRTSSDRTACPHTRDDFGMRSGSNAIVTLNEFTYKQGTEICGEEEPADYVYQVKKGAVRSYKLLSDGRRQIAAFHLVGDIFGLVNGESHRFTAEAVVETTLRLVKRKSLYAALNSDAVVSRTLRTMTANNLQHAENHMLLLGRKSSLEKVAAFLIEMDSRLTAAGVMTLPMMRRDIGDYLGLTVETVARELSRMRRAGVLNFISKNQREIVILNRKRLATFDSLG